jgi:hypothetical protein
LLLSLLEVGFKVSVAFAAEVGSGPRLPDLNGDGVVDMRDIAIAIRACGSQAGDPNWNSAADLNYDGVVNMDDVAAIVKDFAKKCRTYDFNDMSDWIVSGGNWSVQNGTLEGSSSYDGLIYVGDAAWKDSAFTARLKFAGDSEYTEAAVAFLARARDPNNFYYAGLGCWGHRVSISTRVGGVWRELAFSGDVADVEKDVWYVLAVKVSGGAIMLYLDGSLELSVNDSTFVSGSVGISIWDSHVIVDYVTAIGTIDRSNANLAVIPDDWYYTQYPNIHLDYDVVRTPGDPSIRLEPHTANDTNSAREVDGKWYDIKPGDHVVAKCWMRVLTGPSTYGYPYCGARIGIDFYGGSPYRLLDAAQFWSDYYGGDFSKGYVQDSNGGAWQQRMIDIVVPATVGDSAGNPQVPTQFVLWLQGAPWIVDSTSTSVWFADAELYINPT